MRTLTLDLLRHGETTASGIYQGRTDVPLSEKGKQQMQQALGKTAGWQRMFCSPLQRCRCPAEDAVNRLGLTLQSEAWLQEYDFGDWDGRALADVYNEQPEKVDTFWRDPHANPAPGGERIDDFCKRVTVGRDRLLETDERHVLMVTHGGVIRALIGECLGIKPAQWSRLKLDHAHFTRLNYYTDRDQVWPELVCCNTATLPD
ncbi:histidine phosphatase family protein [Pontibacterium granulatum]|uniref:histidine phosphatase family protein n=1 Tax=Pontibacterium granulatum TaxID=2036029 RepID=UPI00249A325E|nr:histidine phosphatase family protein [Pontibacterium granulatum]MDI3323227.1 histidine phosphatase family protein [Pontibacterium granulatum]